MNLKQILMTRDELSEREAIAEIRTMRARVAAGEDPEEVLYDIGFEPDYVFDIL